MRGPQSLTIVLLLLLIASPASAVTQFAIETADGTPNSRGWDPSLALDTLGNPHVSYRDATTGDLIYARKTGGAWTIETADGSANHVGASSSIALDAQGNPHIGYQDVTNLDIKYAHKSGGAWVIETVEASPNNLSDPSLALDASGNPHICYEDVQNFDLKYARKSGGIWIREIADGSGLVGQYSSLALDAQGNPHVSYQDVGTLGSFDLKYAEKSGGTWTREFVDASANNLGSYIALALDAQGGPHVSYYDATTDDLKYARKSGGLWTIETADGSANDVGQWTSIAVDVLGDPHVSYYDGTASDLKYARKSGGIWTTQVVDGSANSVGLGTSLELDALESPRISYHDLTNANLKYAVASPWNSMWRAETDIYPDTYCPWVLTDAAEPENPALSNDILTISTSEGAEYMYYRQTASLSFPDVLLISARCRVVSETRLDNNPRRGTSIVFVVAPDSGNFLAVGRDTVFLRSAYEVEGPKAFVDTDDAFHTYTIKVVNDSAITVYQDNAQILTGAVFNSTGFGSVPNIRWGDENVSASGTAEWAFVMHNANTTECGTTVDVSPHGSGTNSISLIAYPNPTRGPLTLAIRAITDQGDRTRVRIYDVSGRLVRNLEPRSVVAGLNRLSWDGYDYQGGALSSGIYILQLESAGRVIGSSKATILR